MFTCLPRRYRTEEDDYAPRDYSYVGSVAEGERRRQAQAIHENGERAAVRHRADPNAPPAGEERPDDGVRGLDAARRIPRSTDGPAPATRIAYPRPRDNAFAQNSAYAPRPAPTLEEDAQRSAYAPNAGETASASRRVPRAYGGPSPTQAAEAVPDGPLDRREAGGYASPPAERPPARAIPADAAAARAGTGGVQAGDLLAADGSRYAMPETQDMPEWLRMARRNNMPLEADAARRSPKVEPVPRQAQDAPRVDPLGRPIRRSALAQPETLAPGSAEAYEAAGYPPDLIEQQRALQQQNAAAYGYGRKRHGAQLAAPPPGPAQAARHRDMRSASPGVPPLPPGETFAPGRGYAPGSVPETPGPGFAPRATYAPASGVGEDAGAFSQPDGRRLADARAGYRPAADGYGDGRAWERAPRDGAGDPYPYRGAGEPYGRPAASGYDAADPYARNRAGRADAYGAPDARPRNPYRELNPALAGDHDPNRGPYEVEDAQEDEHPARKIPWLGIAVFLAAAVTVGLWIAQTSFATQKASVLEARAAAQTRLIDNHPFSYRELIEREAEANNLHPAFVAAIVLNESSFKPDAESDVGARGLMQMMPDTAQWVYGKMGESGAYSFDLMYDPDTNVHYACWYLAFLSDRFRGDPILVSAAFHAGQNTVQNWLNDSRYSTDSVSISLERMTDGPTKTYVTRVLKAFATYRRLYYEGGLEQAGAST
ncbi:MAG: transglycosylase SLT domain-containing protein [Clostridiales bacterium]|nr:transglycosylase SLT domain-containing protein [Clostridiales bacterium]